jgi:hypothetical protein
VPSVNFGDLGQQSGEAAAFDWKWYYSAPGSAIWLVFLAALALPKSNRNINILAVFFPIAVLNLLWPILVKITSMPVSAQSTFSTLYQSLIIGIALLWLMSDYIGRFGVFAKFLLSSVIMFVTVSLCVLSYSTSFTEDVAVLLTLFTCMTFALLFAITFSRLMCKQKYSQKRFMVWLALWMLLLGSLATIMFFIMVSLIQSSWPSNLISEFSSVAGIGLIFGLVVYVFNLPFMIMGFVNPFYRERFLTCMRLKPAAVSTDSGGRDMPAEDKNGTVCN